MTKKIPQALLLFIVLTLNATAQTVSTVAGQTGISGSANGNGTAATFNGPHGIACDRFGNVYVADRNNNKIRKINSGGVVTTLAGSGLIGASDGNGINATFFEPWGITCDAAGNVYVADTKNYKIRRITPAGVVTTLAGTGVSGTTNGPVASAEFAFPTGVSVANDGAIYVAEFMTHTIRKIYNGTVTTLAGASFLSGDVNGSGALARFDHPHSIVMAKDGSLLVTDVYNNKIKRVTTAGVVTTFAGNGTPGFANGVASNAQFDFPMGITVDSAGAAYVGDINNFLVRKISTGNVTTFAGSQGISGYLDGPALQAQFNSPSGLAFNFLENAIWVGDEGNELIRRTTLSNTTTQTLTLVANSLTNTYCAGDTVTITASPGGLLNYVFKDGATIIATNTTGVLKTTLLSIGTHAITCTATGNAGAQYATINATTLTINSAPAAATITPPGPVSLCAGTSTSLTASAGSGYLWSNGQTTGTIQVSTGGSYSVTVYNNGSCTQYSLPVQVNALPLVTASVTPANPAPICIGDSIMLTANSAASYLWSNGKTTQSIYVKTAGNYSVTVFNASGCSGNSNIVAVTVNPAPTATVTPGGPIVLLSGQVQTLSANTATTYQWSTGASTQSINVSASGSYWVRIKNNNGCWSLRDTVIVQVINQSTNLMVQGQTTFCSGDSATLISPFASGNQWYKNNSVINGAVGQSFVAKQSGYYKVSGTLAGSVTIFSDSVLITVNPVPTATITPGGTILITTGQIVTINANTATTYQWSTGATTQSINVNTSGNYWVRIKNNNGCWSLRDTVVVQLINQSTLLTVQGPTAFCPGDSVKLLSAFATGNQWFKNNIAINGATAQTYVAKQSGYYKVRVTQPGGSNIFSDSVMVTVKTLPTLISSTTDSVCSGERVQLTINVSSGATATWFNQPTGGTSLGSGLNFLTPNLNASTNFYVQLTAAGCTNSQRSAINAFVYPSVTPGFTSTPPTTTGGGFEVIFTATNGSSYDYEWDFGDPNSLSNTSNLPNPTHIYSQEGEYTIMLVATNSAGCSDTAYKTLNVEQESDLFLPNAFTPNSDGLNDIFRLKGSHIESSSMIIVSQWGNIIYNNDDARKGWDGKVNGKFVENATYAYVVRVKREGEPEKILKGNISLIR